MNKRKKITTKKLVRKPTRRNVINNQPDQSLAYKTESLDFPLWMIDELETEARRLAVSKDTLIKVWLDDRLQKLKTDVSFLTKQEKKKAGYRI